MEDRILIAYEHYRDASQRFEYFFSGVIAATCAFIAQSFEPAKIDFNPELLELLSLLTLLTSFFLSLLRMEAIVKLFRDSHYQLFANRDRVALLENKHKGYLKDENTGEVLSPSEINMRIKSLDQIIPDFNKNIDKTNETTIKYRTLRNYSFYLGIITLLISRILSSYV